MQHFFSFFNINTDVRMNKYLPSKHFSNRTFMYLIVHKLLWKRKKNISKNHEYFINNSKCFFFFFYNTSRTTSAWCAEDIKEPWKACYWTLIEVRNKHIRKWKSLWIRANWNSPMYSAFGMRKRRVIENHLRISLFFFFYVKSNLIKYKSHR